MNRRRQPFQGCALPPELPGHSKRCRGRTPARLRNTLKLGGITSHADNQNPTARETALIIATRRQSLNAGSRLPYPRREKRLATVVSPRDARAFAAVSQNRRGCMVSSADCRRGGKLRLSCCLMREMRVAFDPRSNCDHGRRSRRERLAIRPASIHIGNARGAPGSPRARHAKFCRPRPKAAEDNAHQRPEADPFCCSHDSRAGD